MAFVGIQIHINKFKKIFRLHKTAVKKPINTYNLTNLYIIIKSTGNVFKVIKTILP